MSQQTAEVMTFSSANNKVAENFTIKDFFKIDDLPVDKKAEFFSTYFRAQIAAGLPVRREIVSPLDHRVLVRDNVTAEVREMVMFGSNNYLGLANHPDVMKKIEGYIQKHGIGLGGPPLLNGTTSLHLAIEKRLAEFKHAEDAMLFTSGFATNYGLITALVGRNDALIVDELSHASIRDGAKACRGTEYVFAHNDVNELRAALKNATIENKNTKFVVIEGVYSMDGDIPPLPEIHKVTKEFGGFLIIDDAHGTGMFGARGHGIAEHFGLEGEIDLTVGTFSKAFAASGGFIAGKRAILDYLRFFSRTYFFSASASPISIAQAMASLEIIEEHPELIRRLLNNADYIVKGLRSIGFNVHTDSAIIPVCIPAELNIRTLARELDCAGIFLNHIEYPAVPVEKQRFRISAMATHTREDMDQLIRAFETMGTRFGLIKKCYKEYSV